MDETAVARLRKEVLHGGHKGGDPPHDRRLCKLCIHVWICSLPPTTRFSLSSLSFISLSPPLSSSFSYYYYYYRHSFSYLSLSSFLLHPPLPHSSFISRVLLLGLLRGLEDNAIKLKDLFGRQLAASHGQYLLVALRTTPPPPRHDTHDPPRLLIPPAPRLPLLLLS